MMRPPEPPSMSTLGSQKSRLEKNHNYIRVKREAVAAADGESDEGKVFSEVEISIHVEII